MILSNGRFKGPSSLHLLLIDVCCVPTHLSAHAFTPWMLWVMEWLPTTMVLYSLVSCRHYIHGPHVVDGVEVTGGRGAPLGQHWVPWECLQLHPSKWGVFHHSPDVLYRGRGSRLYPPCRILSFEPALFTKAFILADPVVFLINIVGQVQMLFIIYYQLKPGSLNVKLHVGIFQRVTQVLTFQSLTTTCKAQEKNMMEMSPLAWMLAKLRYSGSSTSFRTK